ncbi:Uncharacterised protein [Bordetella bronchiseptica]|nr:Uncharacterised protein [Bordetella bronchiseptica]
MYAARNRNWLSPALLAVLRGASLRRAVTTRFAAAFTTQDAAAIPWSALPALQCPQRSSRRSASCGYGRCAPGRFHAMPVAQSVLGGLRYAAELRADSRQSLGWQTSPCVLPTDGTRLQRRASPRRRSRPRHCVRCRSGCVPAARRVLPGDAAAAAAARRPARPFADLPGHCSGKAASSPTAMPNRRRLRLRARGTYVLFYTYTSYTYRPAQPSCGERVRSVAEQACCQRNRQAMAVGRLPRSPATAASGANYRHRGIDCGPQWKRLQVPAPALPECGRPPEPPGCFRGRWRLAKARADWHRVRMPAGSAGRFREPDSSLSTWPVRGSLCWPTRLIHPVSRSTMRTRRAVSYPARCPRGVVVR